MNMLSTYAPEAATFQGLVVAKEFYIQGNAVHFSLIVADHPQVYVTAVVEANDATDSIAWNTTSSHADDRRCGVRGYFYHDRRSRFFLNLLKLLLHYGFALASGFLASGKVLRFFAARAGGYKPAVNHAAELLCHIKP